MALKIVAAFFLLLAAGGVILTAKEFAIAAGLGGDIAEYNVVKAIFDLALALVFFGIGYYFTKPWSKKLYVIAGIATIILVLLGINASQM